MLKMASINLSTAGTCRKNFLQSKQYNQIFVEYSNYLKSFYSGVNNLEIIIDSNRLIIAACFVDFVVFVKIK